MDELWQAVGSRWDCTVVGTLEDEGMSARLTLSDADAVELMLPLTRVAALELRDALDRWLGS